MWFELSGQVTGLSYLPNFKPVPRSSWDLIDFMMASWLMHAGIPDFAWKVYWDWARLSCYVTNAHLPAHPEWPAYERTSTMNPSSRSGKRAILFTKLQIRTAISMRFYDRLSVDRCRDSGIRMMNYWDWVKTYLLRYKHISARSSGMTGMRGRSP